MAKDPNEYVDSGIAAAYPDASVDSTEVLKSHSRRFSSDWRPAVGAHIQNESFFRKSIKRSEVINCHLHNVDFSRSASSGSIWDDCDFTECNFDRSNLQYSRFRNSDFLGRNLFNGSIFSGSSFYHCNITKQKFVGSSFLSCSFDNSIIDACSVESCDFEDATFIGTAIENTNLSNTSMEYADLRLSKPKNVRISLAQFSYVFGINVDDIKNEDIKISTSNSQFKERFLPWDSLVTIIPNIVNHYRKNNQIFPYANLLFMSGYEDELKKAIEAGVRYCGATEKYRELKYISKLAKISKIYSKNELASLYDDFISSILNDIHSQEFHRFDKYIKEFLLSDENDQLVDVVFFIDPIKYIEEDITTWFISIITRGCLCQNYELSWSSVSSTIESPGYVRGKVKAKRKNKDKTSTEQHTDQSKLQYVNTIIALVGVVISALPILKDLEKSKEDEIKIIRNEIRDNVTINKFYASYNGTLLAKLSGDNKIEWIDKRQRDIIDGYPLACLPPMSEIVQKSGASR